VTLAPAGEDGGTKKFVDDRDFVFCKAIFMSSLMQNNQENHTKGFVRK
jgi:hypothetical protein